MDRKVVSGIMLTLLLVGMLTLAFNIQPVKASGTIYIRPDGSMDPLTAPIQRDGDIYTFTDNIYESIVVERDNIVVDGAGYSLQGTGADGSKGIDLTGISNVTTKNMEIGGFYYGVYLDYSSNCTVFGNTITNNRMGIQVKRTQNCTISENVMNSNDYNFYVYGYELSHFIHSIDTSNLVEGKPVYYLVNQEDLLISVVTHPQVGYLALINSTNITVEGQILTNNGQGLLLAYTTYSTIINNNITNNLYGIELEGSHDPDWGFYSDSNIIVANNRISNSNIKLYGGSNIVANNTISNSNLTLLGDANVVANNTISNGTISFTWGWNNKVLNNTLENGAIAFYTTEGDIIGNRIRYGSEHYWWQNLTGIWVGPGATRFGGFYGVIEGNVIQDCYYGIQFTMHEGIYEPSWAKITQNVILNNSVGLWMNEWAYAKVTENTFKNNILALNITTEAWLDNHFYHNNFIDNYVQVISFSPVDAWDNGYPSGGNYWSDYKERYPYAEELDDSGIWDTPYMIDENNQDNYPLMEPWSPLPRTLHELKTKIKELGSQGEIDNQGIVKSLIAKLNVAQKLVDKGNIDEAKTILEYDFIVQVQNLSRIHITPEAADILIKSAEHIISHL